VIEVGVAGRGLDGGISGDRAVVADAHGVTLLVVIDGLGHGPAAAEASEAAAGILEARPGDPLPELFERCHAALSRTRGVVMTAARIDGAGELEWAGVGNVEARLVRAGARHAGPHSPFLFGGVVGHQLRRKVRPSRLQLGRGDLILMATDGVHADFSTGLPVHGTVQAVADRVLQTSSKAHDDALVLAARWLGEPR
jgi:hypothetical protein